MADENYVNPAWYIVVPVLFFFATVGLCCLKLRENQKRRVLTSVTALRRRRALRHRTDSNRAQARDHRPRTSAERCVYVIDDAALPPYSPPPPPYRIEDLPPPPSYEEALSQPVIREDGSPCL